MPAADANENRSDSSLFNFTADLPAHHASTANYPATACDGWEQRAAPNYASDRRAT